MTLGVGEMIFRTIYESVGAQKVVSDYRTVSSAARAAAKQINAASAAMTDPGAAISKTSQTVAAQSQAIKKNISGLANEIAATGFRLTFYALTALSAGRALIQGLIVKGMAQAASEFENAMDRIADAASITGARLHRLRSDVLSLATALNVDATQAANALAEAIILGFSEQDFFQHIAEPFSLLAKATSENYDILTAKGENLLRVWGQTAQMAPTLAAQLRLLADTTGRSLTQDLLPVLLDIAPMLQRVAPEQVMALMQVAGRFSTEALRSLPLLINAIFKRTMGQIPRNLGTLLAQISESDIAPFMEALGGRAQAVKFLEYLRRVGREGFQEIVKQMAAFSDRQRAMASLTDAATSELNKFDKAVAETAVALRNLFTTMGQGPLKILTFGIQAVHNLIRTISIMPRPVLEAASALFTVGSGISAVVAVGLIAAGTFGIIANRVADFVHQARIQGIVIDSWSALAKTFGLLSLKGNLGEAITGMRIFGRLLLAPLRFLAPIAGLIAVITMLTSDWAESLEDRGFVRFAAFLKQIRTWLEDSTSAMRATWTLGMGIAKSITAILSPLRGIIDGLVAGFGVGLAAPFWVLAGALKTIHALLTEITKTFSELADHIQKRWPGIANFFKGVANSIDSIGRALGTLPGMLIGFTVSMGILMGTLRSLGTIMAWLLRLGTPLLKGGASLILRGLGGLPILSPWLRTVMAQAQRGALQQAALQIRGKIPKGARLVGGVFVPPGADISYARPLGAAIRNSIAQAFSTTIKTLRRAFLTKPPEVAKGIARIISAFAGSLANAARSLFVGFPKALSGFFRGFLGRPGIVAPGFAPGVAKGGPGFLAAILNRLPFLGKILKFLGRVPLGAPIAVALDLLSGASIQRAIGGGIGMAAGSVLGTAIGGAVAGTIGGPLGSIAGFILGLLSSLGGYALGSSVGGLLERPQPAPVLAPVPSTISPTITFNAYVTINTQGTTREQAIEIVRTTLEIFEREKANLWRERDEILKVLKASQGR